MSLNRKIIAVFASMLIFSACSRTADSIIEDNIKARGGEDNIRSIKSLVVNAKLSSMGLDMPMTIYKQDTDKMRIDMNLMGQEIITVYNGNQGWVGSGDSIKIIPPDRLQSIKSEMNKNFNFFQTQLFDYQKKGLHPKLIGREKLKGKEVYKISITMKDSSENIYYIDADSFLDVKMIAKTKNNGKTNIAEVFFRDYKKVKNLMIPHSIEIKSNGRTDAMLIYNQIRINEKVDNSVFTKPV